MALYRSVGWCLAALMLTASAVSVAAAELPEPTHKQVRSIYAKLDGLRLPMHTFALGPEDNLWMCCAASPDPAEIRGKLLVYSGGGEFVRAIDVPFTPQAIGFAPGGDSLYVAGSGHIAKLTTDGAVTKSVDAPNVQDRQQMLERLREKQRESMQEAAQSMKQQRERIEAQLGKLAIAPKNESEKSAARRERRIRLLEKQLDQFDKSLERYGVSDAPVDDSMLQRVLRATAVAVSDLDVFLAVPSTEGYGYDVWRMSHELTEPQIVISGGNGCCGQYDVQTDGENIVVAENTNFEVAIYDRDGKKLRSWGERSYNEAEGFGSCCNPMNVRCAPNGDILTAESSIGHIKRVTADGKFVGYIGTASIAGGCKHVAIAYDDARDWHYMYNQDRSCVSVLVPLAEAPAETEEERDSRLAMEGLGKRLVGTWKIAATAKPAASEGGAGVDLDSYLQQQYGTVSFAADGGLTKGKQEDSASSFASALTALTGSDEAAAMLTAEHRSSKWQAVRQEGDMLYIITVEDGVKSFGAAVEFIGDRDAKFTFNYGSEDSPLAEPIIYRKAE